MIRISYLEPNESLEWVIVWGIGLLAGLACIVGAFFIRERGE